MRKKRGIAKRTLGMLIATVLLSSTVSTGVFAEDLVEDVPVFGEETDAVPEEGIVSDEAAYTGGEALAGYAWETPDDETAAVDGEETPDEDLSYGGDDSFVEEITPEDIIATETPADDGAGSFYEEASDEITDDIIFEDIDEDTLTADEELSDESSSAEGILADEENSEAGSADTAPDASFPEPDGIAAVMKTVTVTFADAGAAEGFQAVCNERYLAVTSEGGGVYTCQVKENASVTIKPLLKANYRFKSAKKDGKSVSTKTGALSFKVSKDTAVTYTTLDPLHIEVDGKSVKNNATVTVNHSGSVYLYVKKASGTYMAITSASASPNVKDVLTKYDTSVVFNCTKASEAKKSAVTVTLKGEGYTYKVKLKLRPKVTKITLKGFKNGKASQPAGTRVYYEIGANSGVNIDDIHLDSAERPEGVYVGTDTRNGKKCIYVDFYNGFSLPAAGSNLKIVMGADGTTKKFNFSVKITAPAMPAPTVKVKNITDTLAKLTLSVPKSARNYQRLYYKIEAKAVVPGGGSVAEGMKDEVTEYVEVTEFRKENPYDYTLLLSDQEEGKGKKQKYDLSVSLVQAAESGNPDVPYGAAGRYKVNKNTISTLDPAYETKLSLTKKNTTVYWGQEDVLLAVAKFSKNTSYSRISEEDCYLEFADGSTTDAEIEVGDDGKSIYLEDVYYYYHKPGKAILHVKAVSPDGDFYSPEATMAITIKRSIDSFSVVPSSSVIYKKPGKAATLTARVEAYDDDSEPVANPKVKWSITADSPLKGIKIDKKGKVTIPKKLILFADDDRNYFNVRADAADYPGNGAYDYEKVYVRSEPVEVGRFRIQRDFADPETVIEDLSAGLSPSDLVGSYIVPYTPDGTTFYELEYSTGKALSVTCSDPDAFEFYDYGYGIRKITAVKKAGTFTIKISTKDGGKKSCSATIKVKKASEGSLAETRFTLYAATDYYSGGFEEIAFSAENTANHYDAYCETFSVISSRPGADGVYLDDARVTVESGGIIGEKYYGKTGEGYWDIWPTAPSTVLKYSAGGVEKTYTVRNAYFNSLPATEVTLTEQDEYDYTFPASGGGANLQYDYAIANLAALPEEAENTGYWTQGMSYRYNIHLFEDPEMASGSDYKKFFNALSLSGYVIEHPRGEAEDPHAFSLFLRTPSVKPGTYKAYVLIEKESWCGTYGFTQNPDTTWRAHAVSNLIPVTFTAKSGSKTTKPAKAPTGTLTAKYNVSKEAEASFKLSLSKPKNVANVVYTRIWNNNKNGMPNQFTRYFELDRTGNVKLKEGVNLSEITATDMTGYATYIMYNKDGKSVTKTSAFTVSWK